MNCNYRFACSYLINIFAPHFVVILVNQTLTMARALDLAKANFLFRSLMIACKSLIFLFFLLICADFSLNLFS